MGKGIFEITPDLLESVLLLPEGMKIIKIQQNHRFERDVYSVMVGHDDIPTREPGDLLPRIRLEYRTYYDEQSTMRQTVLSDWKAVDFESTTLNSIEH